MYAGLAPNFKRFESRIRMRDQAGALKAERAGSVPVGKLPFVRRQLHVVENAFRCAFEFNAARYCAC